MRISEAAEQPGASIRPLRHYERAGLLEAGITISEILPISACLVKGEYSEPCSAAVAELYRRKLDRIRRRRRWL